LSGCAITNDATGFGWMLPLVLLSPRPALIPASAGLITVNAQCRSEVPHIFAAGNVVGPPALAATGMEQVRMAMCVACEVDYKDVVAPILPIGIFSHRIDFEKIAVVGNPRWEAQVLAFTGTGLRKGPVKFFPETGESEARAWLAK
jgi:hypothetical protein